MRTLFKFFVIVLALTMVAVVVSTSVLPGIIGIDETRDASKRTAIVLAGARDPDGLLGFESRARTYAAVDLMSSRSVVSLMMSGGRADPTHQSLAEDMRDLAIQQGSDAGSILIETESTTTFENIRLSLAQLDASADSPIVIVSAGYHLPRAWVLAAYFGRPDARIHSAYPLGEMHAATAFMAVLREATAWWYNLGKIAVWEGLSLAGLSKDERSEIVR